MTLRLLMDDELKIVASVQDRGASVFENPWYRSTIAFETIFERDY